MTINTVEPMSFRIYMAGDIGVARNKCMEFCFNAGFCVNLQPTTYIYTGGVEEGFVVEAIAYGRFPNNISEIKDKMILLGSQLKEVCYQLSWSLVTPEESIYFADESKDR